MFLKDSGEGLGNMDIRYCSGIAGLTAGAFTLYLVFSFYIVASVLCSSILDQFQKVCWENGVQVGKY